ncbi:MAG TPA: 30S ribosomal protein S6 [Acidimicrobiia bacterium]
MRTYEVMTIHRPDLSEDDVRAKVDELEGYLTEKGAKVGSKDLWGKRRFSYEINHLHEGFYSVVTFDGEPDLVAEMERMLSLADEVVRHKVVKPGS